MNNIPNFDPSKMDPKVLMELSQLVQQLSPPQMNRLQTLMHNMMAGYDVKKEMDEFEKTLPSGFREKLTGLMASQGGLFGMDAFAQSPGAQTSSSELYRDGAGATVAPSSDDDLEKLSEADMNLREARLTVLRAVSQGSVSPEEAERLLFKEI